MPKKIYMELIQCLNKHFGTILVPEKEFLFCNFVKPPAVRVTKLSGFPGVFLILELNIPHPGKHFCPRKTWMTSYLRSYKSYFRK